MDERSAKCVMVLDEQLPIGLAVNTAAVLALTLGSGVKALLGPDVRDGSGHVHVGITTLPIPILKADGEKLKRLWLQARERGDVFVVDFTDVAQTSHVYEEYTQKIAALSAEQLHYLGVALYGKKEAVNKLTGSLPLLR
ncbi:MAG TPA: DUF2000 domain-containing protein [Ktedonobacterales bacterium]|nr:DUF2000 domain-containing protein [Ktedonobacterales bacterium]